jgi:4-azaleucine resistance transporter AzlC
VSQAQVTRAAGAPGKHRYRDGARRILPFAVAGAAFGASFGVLADAAGVGPVAAVVMSATTFGGSAQFAAVSVLDGGGGAAAAVGAAVLLNARYGPISISIGPAFEGPAWRRFLEAQLVVDESWAISTVGPGRYSRRLLVGAGLVLYAAWVGGTAVGALGASWLGDPERLGLDAAFPALFLALLVSFVRERRTLTAAVLAAAVALVLVPVAAPGVPILAASSVCLLGLVRR